MSTAELLIVFVLDLRGTAGDSCSDPGGGGGDDWQLGDDLMLFSIPKSRN